jgi:hypothetical protein
MNGQKVPPVRMKSPFIARNGGRGGCVPRA